MNKEEILAMEAGRNLDELVADKVMGWVDFWKSQHHLMGYPPIEQNLGVGYDERHPVPQYSTDLSAAWEVARKFELSGFLVNYLTDNPFGDGWHCVVNHEHHARECKTAPEAICKAALLAVMDS